MSPGETTLSPSVAVLPEIQTRFPARTARQYPAHSSFGQSDENRVCAAKGARSSSGNWVLFLQADTVVLRRDSVQCKCGARTATPHPFLVAAVALRDGRALP